MKTEKKSWSSRHKNHLNAVDRPLQSLKLPGKSHLGPGGSVLEVEDQVEADQVPDVAGAQALAVVQEGL